MKDFRLYVILDKELLIDKDIIEVARQIIKGGADLIQYRDKISLRQDILKTALKLRGLDFPLIINDFPDIAKEVDALGVHIGQDDVNIKHARALLGPDKIIGKSAVDLEQALNAEKNGADYIGFGPIFNTNTKKNTVALGTDILLKVVGAISIPLFAIGGIDLSNLKYVLAAGVNRVAVASSIICSEDIERSIKDFSIKLKYESDRISQKR